MLIALIALGGAAGALARFSLGGYIYRKLGTAFPWGTLGVNVLGSLLLGIALAATAENVHRAALHAVLAVGFLGDFTTFSSFAHETVALGRGRLPLRAGIYVVASVVASLTAVVAGVAIGS